MSSAVPIHPMLRLARRHASTAAMASAHELALAQPRLPRQRVLGRKQWRRRDTALQVRTMSHTPTMLAKRGKTAPAAVNAAGPSSSSSSPPSSSSAAAAASRNSADTGAQAGTPKDSAALRAYAASVRAKPSTPPPVVKLTDKRTEQQKMQSQEARDLSANGSAERDGPKKTEHVCADETSASSGSSSSSSSEDRRSEPEGEAQKLLNKGANKQRHGASVEIHQGREPPQAQRGNGPSSTGNPLAEGEFIPADASQRASARDGGRAHFSADTTKTEGVSASGTAGGGSSDGGGPSSAANGNGGGGDGGSPPVESAQVPDLGSAPPAPIVHPFDTHGFVKRLQEASFARQHLEAAADAKESTSLVQGNRHDPAEAIMQALRHLLVAQGDILIGRHMNKTEVENQAYLFTAALAELRTELQVRARNDAAALRSMVTLVQREVDALNQRMREDVAGMKHDIQVDMNNRKGEAKDEQNTLEQEIQDLNNRFTISISDLKTEIEQSIKWDATRRALTLFFGSIVILIATLALADYLTRDLEEGGAGSTDGNSNNRAAAALGAAGGAGGASMREGSGGASSRSSGPFAPTGSSSGGSGSGTGTGTGTGSSMMGSFDDIRPRSAEELGVVPKYDEEHASRYV